MLQTLERRINIEEVSFYLTSTLLLTRNLPFDSDASQ